MAVDFQADSGDTEVNLDHILYKEKSEHRIVGYVGDSPSNRLKVRTTSGDIELN
ncbi:DUF4097 domain-containing protein [Bacillus spizizenii]|nr:DUF4097 domain-containing protein [Bacillus spizizenii]